MCTNDSWASLLYVKGKYNSSILILVPYSDVYLCFGMDIMEKYSVGELRGENKTVFNLVLFLGL